MAANLLERPVSRLQALQNPSLPWSFVARHLVSLLKSYSTGLSFEVAADEILAAWRTHKKKKPEKKAVPFLTGTISHISPGPPELWLVRLSDASLVAWFAHTSFEGRLRPGSVISFAEPDAVEPMPEFVNLAQKAFQDAPGLEHKSPTAVAEMPESANNTPVKNSQGEINSQSPVDVSKFPSRNEQLAITPSQVNHPSNPAARLKRLLLPTANIFVDLDSIDHSFLGLLEPPEAFSLQRVWDERALTPDWIFAQVVETVKTPEISIWLQDPSENTCSQQPSVLWRLPQELEILTSILTSGAVVLLKCPLVQPTGSSFEVVVSSETSYFYRSNSTFDLFGNAAGGLEEGTKAIPSRPMKRPRVDSNLVEDSTQVSTKCLSRLISPESQPALTVHTQVCAPPQRLEAYLTMVPCQDGVQIRVVGSEAAQRANYLQVGDEVLFDGVVWAPAVESFGRQTAAGWVGSSLDTLSTMGGFLHSSFARSITSVGVVCARQFEVTKGKSSNPWKGCFQINVGIKDVRLVPSDGKVQMSVYDAMGPNEGHGQQSVSGSSVLEAVGEEVSCEVFLVTVRERCFEELFRTPNANSFWGGDASRKVSESLARLREGWWLMMVSCGKDTPEVCACVPGLANGK